MEMHVEIGIHLLLLDGDKLLMQKRLSKKFGGESKWAPICGRVEYGEISVECSVREAKEELGIDIENPKIFCMHEIMDETGYYICVGVVARKWKGIPQNLEPRKCAELKWFDLDKLPDDMMPSTKITVSLFRGGKFN